ncbi:GNAT family N-acetyltransferase [Cohnella nanjingensis]|uniref:GNAT family N-acetyltransferase n=1 Tax=Cohnella nanjingensis TaxID=1387779 RepID=A0A7X0RKI8_9BACL|nr:GNAT family N-acetyltransferase [Cohnella nanjingensis]MBB6669153.1 GNAT family N-acetyltransferase [Cohnella nanjingensis]
MKCIAVTDSAQLAECLRIRTEVFVKEQGVSIDLEVDEYDASPTACRHFLALDEGAPVGASRWRAYKHGVAKLQRIAVLAAYRGRSVGRLLVRAMEADAAAQGYSEAILDAQCSAEAFYVKLGYEKVSDETFYDAGILHVRMRHSLV